MAARWSEGDVVDLDDGREAAEARWDEADDADGPATDAVPDGPDLPGGDQSGGDERGPARRWRAGALVAACAVAATVGALAEGLHAHAVADARVQRAQAGLSLRVDDVEVAADDTLWRRGRPARGTASATIFSLVDNAGPATVEVVGLQVRAGHVASQRVPLQARIAPGTITTLPVPVLVGCVGAPARSRYLASSQRPQLLVALRVGGKVVHQVLSMPSSAIDDVRYGVLGVCDPPQGG